MRQYRGSSGEERQAERRLQLITAALHVYGELGHSRASVRRICRQAALSERYFYESFANGEALLAAAFDYAAGIFIEQLQGLGQAPELRVVLTAYFDVMRRHPNFTRVFLLEAPAAGGPIYQRFYAVQERFSDILARLSRRPEDRMYLAGLAGGLSQIARHWTINGFAAPFEQVLESAERLCSPLKE